MTDEKNAPKPNDAPAETTFTADRDTPETLDEMFELPEVKALLPQRDTPAPGDQAPAVHDGDLWDGPRMIRNAQAEPIFVRTKAEYWDLLRRNGVRMRDQQESTTGQAAGPPPPPPVKLHETPHPAVAPLSKHEAEVFGAITVVFRRYNLVESLWCTHCFSRNQAHGCKMVVNARGVVLQCRGGIAGWHTPVGERNVLLHTLANTPRAGLLDTAPGTVLTPAGPVFKPARLLVPEEVMIAREYFNTLRRRGIDPRWHHRACWSGNPWHEDDALAIYVDDESLVAVCACQQLYARSSRPTPPLIH